MFILFFIFKIQNFLSKHIIMKNFLIYTLATITGIIIASILFFVITIAANKIKLCGKSLRGF